jgi:hypothetical protein
MATIEQLRTDRSRDALNQSIDRAQETRGDLRAQTAQQAKRTAALRGAVADGLESGRAGDAATTGATVVGNSGITETTTGPNPFTTLTSASTPHESAQLHLAEPVPMDQELGPESQRLLRLGALDLAAHARGDAKAQASLARVRAGTMLLLADDDAIAAETLGDAHPAARTVGQKLVEHIAELKSDKHAKLILNEQAQVARSSFPAGMSVDAFVQAVLRESYALQDDIVKDIATELDEANEQRKAYRAKLQRLRELKTKLKTGLTDAELAELAELGIAIDEKEVGALAQDFTWEHDSDLQAAQAALEQAQANLAQQQGQLEAMQAPLYQAPEPVTTYTYSPSVDASVIAAFQAEGDASSKALFDNILNAYDTQRNDGESNREDVFTYAFNGGTQLKEKLSAAEVQDAFARYGATLSPGDLCDVLRTLLYSVSVSSVRDRNHTTEQTERADALLRTLADSLSPEQLDLLQRDHPDLWAKVDSATDGTLTTRNEEYTKLRYYGFSSGSPTLNRAYQQFALARSHWFVDPYMAALRESLSGLPGSEAREFLAKVANNTPPPGLDTTTFDKCVTACDPNQLFAAATPEALAYFQTAGVQSVAIFREWSNATEVKKEVAATPEQQTAVVADAQAALTAAQAKVDELTAQRTEAATATGAAAFDTLLDEKLDNAIKDTEGDIESAGGDAQLLQLRLQDAMQKKQELMQMMSNLSKMMHETIMAIIRNMGG